MDPQELEGYRDQLKQVELLLKEDPSNADWLKLKSDLVEIITLSEGLLKPPAKATGQPELGSTKAEATTPHDSTAASTATATATEPKSKKRKSQSSSASGPSKAKLQKDQQNSWLDFVQKKGKKKKAASAINTHSIFASPTTTQGKVGVVGSGKPMTEFQGRNKHIYRPVD
ncbi:hypothetical protein IWQ61_000957 [Dispira simplex]|nr:hypothetical protein IWQ61_000957 [Dispira simplex]